MVDETQTTPSIPLVPAKPDRRYHPHPPIVPFGVWTWNTPVVPQFYYNVYSQEQRIKQICVEIGRIEAYLDYAVPFANAAHAALSKRIDDLTEQLANEVQRLDQLIADETENRIEADKQLGVRIDQEIEDREQADEALGGRIDKEITDREQADKALQTAIDQLETLTTQLRADLTTETNNRVNGDNALGERIDTEIQARTDADTALGKRIDAEIQARTDADTALGGRVEAETTARQQADAALRTDINRRPRANNITAGDGISIQATEDPDNGENTRVVVSSTVSADIATLTKRIATEEDTREAEDTALNARIADEITNREQADDDIWAAINSKVGGHSTAPITGDGSSDNPYGLNYEADDFTVSDNALHINGDTYATHAEITREINTAVEQETNARSAADSQLQQQLNGKLDSVSVGHMLSGNGETEPLNLRNVQITENRPVGFGTIKFDDVESHNLYVDPADVDYGGTVKFDANSPIWKNGEGDIDIKVGQGFKVSQGRLDLNPATADTIGGVQVGPFEPFEDNLPHMSGSHLVLRPHDVFAGLFQTVSYGVDDTIAAGETKTYDIKSQVYKPFAVVPNVANTITDGSIVAWIQTHDGLGSVNLCVKNIGTDPVTLDSATTTFELFAFQESYAG